ncbi:SPA2 [Candida margitis]|uniref:SPA2 n=1 Tax=Candida margitis TaxID=1775924 RepID=UPI002227E443|nr:SPA2 [Candida margitis]KAI5969632.1 SPA2 [Candida margitis]
MSENNLVHHYTVLKQFLDISDDQQTRSKSTSSRAQRAREKLLKLSAAQFKELSTDVYDELKRRIDESRGEPDYLLPKSSFHPKRNQARQKLASLPQTRFKDLVADISYEIERRELHIEHKDSAEPRRTSLSSNHTNNAHISHERKASQASSHATNGYHSRSTSHHANDFHPQEHHHKVPDDQLNHSEDHVTSSKNITIPDAEASNQSIGIQQSTVIPTKANLTWSSDEEDDEKDTNDKKEEEGPPQQRQINGDQIGSQQVEFERSKILELEKELDAFKKQLNNVEKQKEALSEKLTSLQDDYDFSVKQNKSLSEELESLGQEKENWISKHETLSKSLQANDKSEELEKLKSINAALRLENQSLKNTSPVNRSISNQSPSQPDLQTKASNANIAGFLDKLEKIDMPSASNPSTLELKNQVKQWQRRYEDSRSKFIASEIKKTTLSKIELKSFISPQGLISIKLVSDAQALLESFLVYIADNWDVNVMFEKVSKIAVIMNEIAAQGEHQVPNSNEHSILLREAAAYALTATRYHATYRSLFPKFIVEKALGEMNCVLCDLVAASKLNENSTNLRKLEPEKKSSATPSQVDYGVRPLKMANKLKSSNPNMINGTYYQTPPQKQQQQRTPPQNTKQSPPQRSQQTQPSTIQQSPPERKDSCLKSGEETSMQGVSYEPKKRGEELQLKQEHHFEHDKTSHPDGLRRIQQLSPEISRQQPHYSGQPSSESNAPTAQPVSVNHKSSADGLSHENNPSQNPFVASVTGRGDSIVPQTIERDAVPLANRDINREPIAEKHPDRHIGNAKTLTPSPSKTERATNVSTLGRKFAEAAVNNDQSSPPAMKTTPTKKGNIMDRVKQFESSPDGQMRSSPQRFQRSPRSFESTDESDAPRRLADPFTSKLQGELEGSAPIARNDDTDTDVPLAGRGRGILQSFKDRSNTESNSNDLNVDAKPEHSSGKDDEGSNREAGYSRAQSKNAPAKEEARRVGDFAPIKHTFDDNEPEVRVRISSPKMPLETSSSGESDDDYEDERDTQSEARQRQEYRKSMAAATFNVDLFDIDDPDNTLTQVLLYLEHQTVEVINTIQSLLGAIKKPNATRSDLRQKSKAITIVISQMCEATNTSMNQTRNAQLKEHGSWVVKSLEDCYHRMDVLCKPAQDSNEGQFADKNFKQRLAGISFDIAKCTKELVKTVEEASLKEDIAYLDARLSRNDEDLT